MGLTGLSWLRILAGFCEHGNEPLGSIRKQDIFFGKLSDNFSNNILHNGESK
jgi:hypothetical protein